MFFTNTIKKSALCLALIGFAAACETEDTESAMGPDSQEILEESGDMGDLSMDTFQIANIDAHHSPVLSAAARELIGADTIPWRRSQFELPKMDTLPRIIFRTPNETEVEARLKSLSGALLGPVASRTPLTDNAQTLAIVTDEGFAYCAKGTGAFTSKRYVPKRGISQVKDAEEAINLALEQVAEAGLLELNENETLDVISVVSNRRAGWYEEDGEMKPVQFETSEGELVTQFKSDYIVRFGRRYRGVPIIADSLRVRLDPSGRVAAFVNPWREIVGEVDTPVRLIAEADARVRQDQDVPSDAVLATKVCGYFEASGLARIQESAGVGCRYTYDNPEELGTLAGQFTMEFSLAEDEELTLDGVKRVVSVPQPEVSRSSADVVDIPN